MLLFCFLLKTLQFHLLSEKFHFSFEGYPTTFELLERGIVDLHVLVLEVNDKAPPDAVDHIIDHCGQLFQDHVALGFCTSFWLVAHIDHVVRL